MAEKTNLKIDGLSFPEIKNNFKSFLQSQNQFKDYNFDASGLSILLDVLSYNTYYNALYLNMISSEAFLSTAQKRNSVIQHARTLNYTPRSVTSAKMKVTLEVTPIGTPTSIIVPKYTSFVADTEDESYYFTTDAAYTFTPDIDGKYILEDITLVEGKKITEKYVKNSSDSTQRFILNNANIDTDTLSVRVINSVIDSTIRVFTRSENIVDVNSASLVYFLEEVEDGKYEIFFGDGITGVDLSDGNLLYIEYLVSGGSAANDIQNATLANPVDGITDIVATVTTASYGGDDREDIERIRFNATKSYASQNRAVTAEDYTSLVLKQPNVGSAIVWGGEDNDPPYYGKVFIAIKPKLGDALTATEKEFLIDTVIKPKKVLTVSVDIVDPEYTYVIIDAIIKYDSTQNILNTTNLSSLIRDVITNYSITDLSEFSRYFRYSKLSRLIDTAERSILSSSMKIKVRKELSVQLNVAATYTINFSNAIDDSTLNRPSNHPYNVGNKLVSNEFTYAGLNQCYLEENNGIIRIYRKFGSSYVGVTSNIGTIDYETGKIVLNSFAPESFSDGGNTLKLTAYPKELDILPLRTQIITILDEDVNINLIDDNSISLTKR